LSSRAERFSSPESINAELGACHDLLKQLANDDSRLIGMGTTIAGLVIHRHQAVVFNVGDSRVYRLRAGRLLQLSVDDARMPVSAGSNLLTKAVGVGGGVGREFTATQRLLTGLSGDDRFLLCSDGLSDFVSQDEIERVCLADDDPAEIANELYGLALERGTRDNVSVVVLALAEVPAPERPVVVRVEKPRPTRLGAIVKRRRAMRDEHEKPNAATNDPDEISG